MSVHMCTRARVRVAACARVCDIYSVLSHVLGVRYCDTSKLEWISAFYQCCCKRWNDRNVCKRVIPSIRSGQPRSGDTPALAVYAVANIARSRAQSHQYAHLHVGTRRSHELLSEVTTTPLPAQLFHRHEYSGSLSSNQIGYAGAVGLSKALMSNTVLLTLE